jgi:pyruvate dehydrogenase E2 component (dihydrolipoamide acetyltransferase)
MEFLMPSLGADMDSGTIAEWRVAPGDDVHRGDIVAVVETDKADIEVEVFADGTVEEILVPEGRRVPVSTPLARLSSPSELPGETTGPPAGLPSPVARPPEVAGTTPPATPATRVRGAPRSAPGAPRTYSPLVRHAADARHIDLAAIAGSGPGGTVTRADVQAALTGRGPRISPRARRLAARSGIDLTAMAATGGSGPGGALTGDDVLGFTRAGEGAEGGASVTLPGTAIDLVPVPAPEPSGVRTAEGPDTPERRRESQRRAVGALMARSKREIPHYYLTQDIELSAPLARLAAGNEGRPPARRLLPAALLLHAVARAAAEVPGFNGHYLAAEDRFVPAEAVHLGVAVALREGGLVAPALHDAATLDLDSLMAALRDLVARARSGRLRGQELAEATITVTNLGERGAQSVHGVIVPPQVALVGFGRVAERPWIADGRIEARPVVTATLSGDHRVTSGHEGSRFLEAVVAALQEEEQ